MVWLSRESPAGPNTVQAPGAGRRGILAARPLRSATWSTPTQSPADCFVSIPRTGRTGGAGNSPEPAVGPALHQNGELMMQALGYLSLPAEYGGDRRDQVVNAAAESLAAFAQRAGYRLAGAFSEVRGQLEDGLSGLVSALRREGTGAVVVPDLSRLRRVGGLVGAGAATAARHLLVVHPTPANDCGPCTGAPGTDPVDGHTDPGRYDARGGVVGARR